MELYVVYTVKTYDDSDDSMSEICQYYSNQGKLSLRKHVINDEVENISVNKDGFYILSKDGDVFIIDDNDEIKPLSIPTKHDDVFVDANNKLVLASGNYDNNSDTALFRFDIYNDELFTRFNCEINGCVTRFNSRYITILECRNDKEYFLRNIEMDTTIDIVVPKQLSERAPKFYLGSKHLIAGSRSRYRNNTLIYSVIDYRTGQWLPIVSAAKIINKDCSLETALSLKSLESAYRLKHSESIVAIPAKSEVLMIEEENYYFLTEYSDKGAGCILVPYKDKIVKYNIINYNINPRSSNQLIIRDLDSNVPFLQRDATLMFHFLERDTDDDGVRYIILPRKKVIKIVSTYRLLKKLSLPHDIVDIIFDYEYPLFSYQELRLFDRYLQGLITIQKLFPRH